jgi:CelD/BcsL family acetyltransferase involved in cellulose biosynthesis
MSLDGKPVAAIYGFLYRRMFYFYQAGFDPDYARLSLGLVAQGLAIQAAMEEGAEGYDFLHGDERYKSLWTRDTRKLVRLVLMPPDYQGFIYRQTAALKCVIKQILNQLRSHR